MPQGFAFEEARGSLDEYERLMVERAHGFAASRFLGQGKHEQVGPFATLAELEAAVKKIFSEDTPESPGWDRGFGVYAICKVSGADHQTHVKNLWRDGRERSGYRSNSARRRTVSQPGRGA